MDLASTNKDEFMFLVIVLIVIAAAAVVLFFKFKQKCDTNEADLAQTASPEQAARNSYASREEAITSLALKARLSGVSHTTRIDDVILRCAEVHHALSAMTPADTAQINNTPADFSRLISNHLPDFVEKFARLGKDIDQETKQGFEDILIQLEAELDKILEDIKTKNFNAFEHKERFMAIRFSDKY
jgi:hypothetical protein